jgi:hypothetical protein
MYRHWACIECQLEWTEMLGPTKKSGKARPSEPGEGWNAPKGIESALPILGNPGIGRPRQMILNQAGVATVPTKLRYQPNA